MSTITIKPAADYTVADLALAEFGRKEIEIAETEMPGLMALRAEFDWTPARSAQILNCSVGLRGSPCPPW